MTTSITDVPKCCMADIGLSLTGEGAQPLVDAINKYLADFAKPIAREGGGFLIGKHVCLKCGEALDGALGTFQWGLVWGEGACSKCDWPARGYHAIKDDTGDIFEEPLPIILQYHPSVVDCPPAEEDETP
jgi:hypothetical protein